MFAFVSVSLAVLGSAQAAVSSRLTAAIAVTNATGSDMDVVTVLTSIGSAVVTASALSSAVDCASVHCGPGVCVWTPAQPVCDCTGTNTTGVNCQLPMHVSPAPATLCPSLTPQECSGHGVCVPCDPASLALTCAAVCE